jgi:hypothetical protein
MPPVVVNATLAEVCGTVNERSCPPLALASL